jgi:hypothetical protein
MVRHGLNDDGKVREGFKLPKLLGGIDVSEAQRYDSKRSSISSPKRLKKFRGVTVRFVKGLPYEGSKRRSRGAPGLS